MFTHLLVGLDGSRHAEAVIPDALDLARRVSAEVTLVRVLPRNLAEVSEWGAMGRRRPAAQSVVSQELVAAERRLDQLAESHRHGGMKIYTDLRYGDPAVEILRASEELRADTIAIAMHARRGLDRLLSGGVAERVVRGTSLPVIVLSAPLV
jgi:nucleotide-binding universal stress UspA family protein